jgi:hypothetical protein
MREAIIAALDSNLHREKRVGPPARVEASGLESVLRVVTGEVGEQHTALDHAFRRLGETPNAVLEAVTKKAVAWVRNTSESQVPALRLSEWIHQAVGELIQPSMERLRSVGQRAVSQLQKIAGEMGRSDLPAQADFEAILRDMPRFELATLPDSIRVSHWRFWGESVLRSRIGAGLRESIGSHLKEELHLYGMALSQWSDLIVRKLEMLVNSYADAYRMQIHRINGTSDAVANPAQLQADLELLKSWRPASAPDLTDAHA